MKAIEVLIVTNLTKISFILLINFFAVKVALINSRHLRILKGCCGTDQQ